MVLPVKLQPGETVEQVFKRHPASIIVKIVLAFLTAAILLFLISKFDDLLPNLRTLWNILNVVVIAGAVLYGVLVFYRYQNDLWLITNQRIVDSTKTSPFNHTVSSADLINVQNISIRKQGVLASIFGFGDVICETASTGGSFAFRGVRKPEEVLENVDRLRDEARRGLAAPGSS